MAMNFNPMDNQDGILMYCAQSEEGLGDFVALVVKDERVEFRYDIGSGLAIIRSNHVLQPGVWTHVSVNRDFKEGNLTINGEPTIGGKSPGTARTMTLNTLLYIGGVDRRRITVNRNAGVSRTFRGCISDVSSYELIQRLSIGLFKLKNIVCHVLLARSVFNECGYTEVSLGFSKHRRL